MCSIKDGLESIGLEKYLEAFQSKGLLLVNDLISCTPVELDRLFNEMSMLKGHTFKMKKLIDDIKAGVPMKPKPSNQTAGSSNFTLNSTLNKFRPESNLVQTKIDMSKMTENSLKDSNEKNKTENISHDSILACLKDFLAVDLETYYKALCQLKHIQNSIRGLVGEEMKSNNI
jgi:hypothetical protein